MSSEFKFPRQIKIKLNPGWMILSKLYFVCVLYGRKTKTNTAFCNLEKNKERISEDVTDLRFLIRFFWPFIRNLKWFSMVFDDVDSSLGSTCDWSM